MNIDNLNLCLLSGACTPLKYLEMVNIGVCISRLSVEGERDWNLEMRAIPFVGSLLSDEAEYPQGFYGVGDAIDALEKKG